MENELAPERSICTQLKEIKQPHQIALVLLSYVLKRPKTWLLAHPELHLTDSQALELDSLINRLENGEPLPYLVGKQDFFGLEFEVNPMVLIPRPETEMMVDVALGWLKAHPSARKGIDVGTGSGIIAVSLVNNCPDLHLLATDISQEALEVANHNAEKHNSADRICFACVDLLPETTENVDLICANLPYIPTSKLSEVNSLGWEPTLALDGGESGLNLIDQLLGRSTTIMNTPGLLLLETEETLGKQTVELARRYFPTAEITLYQDLAHRDRLVTIEMK
jgi:release factor glutamine methyltransferase